MKPNLDSSRVVLDRLNAYEIARREGFPTGWRSYRVSADPLCSTRLFAPGTLAAWRTLLWKRLGDAVLVALFVVAIWALLAGGTR